MLLQHNERIAVTRRLVVAFALVLHVTTWGIAPSRDLSIFGAIVQMVRSSKGASTAARQLRRK